MNVQCSTPREKYRRAGNRRDMCCISYIYILTCAHTKRKMICYIARPPAVTAGKRGLPLPPLPLPDQKKVTKVFINDIKCMHSMRSQASILSIVNSVCVCACVRAVMWCVCACASTVAGANEYGPQTPVPNISVRTPEH